MRTAKVSVFRQRAQLYANEDFWCPPFLEMETDGDNYSYWLVSKFDTV